MSKLEKELGLIQKTPEEEIYDYPKARNLKYIPKIKQTYEMLLFVCGKDGLALEYASKKLITTELCEISVKQNGEAIRYIPQKIIQQNDVNWFYHICKLAVENNGLAIEYIPDDYKDEDIINIVIDSDIIYRGHILGGKENNDRVYNYPIYFVPKEKKSNSIILRSIEKYPFSIKNIPPNTITKEMSILAVTNNGYSIKYIPHRLIDKELLFVAMDNNVMALSVVPDSFKSRELCDYCFEKDCAVLTYIPETFITVDMCLKTIENDKLLLWQFSDEEMIEYYNDSNTNIVLFEDLPEKMRNNRSILDALCEQYDFGTSAVLAWNEEIQEKIDQYGMYSRYVKKNSRGDFVNPLEKTTINYLKSKVVLEDEIEDGEDADKKLDFPGIDMISDIKYSDYIHNSVMALPSDIPSSYSMVKNRKGELTCYDFSESDNGVCNIYYISDIHIGHQILGELSDDPEKTRNKIMGIIERKVSEMISDVSDKNAILLIAGDVANSVEESQLFYNTLFKKWKGNCIISVLGNHELWDGADISSLNAPNYKARDVNTIINEYKTVIDYSGFYETNGYVISHLLNNSLYLEYKNGRGIVISEEQILKASDDDLSELLSKSDRLILGGIGFSGNNPLYNAKKGLYLNTVNTLKQDKYQTQRFKSVYDKINQCAHDKQVIVLTHTPVYDWTSEPCNPNWIYINGHTHQNAVSIVENGPIILADNQIGYESKKWKLKSFTIDEGWYDPFYKYDDGIYKITSDQYKDFNTGRGIQSNGCNFDGDLYMLKKNDIYMFVLKSSSSLCLMVGGQRKRLQNHNIDYYFNNMDRYYEIINKMIEPYKIMMKSISEEVKRFGGSGIIHGCIVDISFYSHIYVNPYDGKITPYWATNISERKVYRDIKMLIEKEESELLNQYLIEYKNNDMPLLNGEISNQNKNNSSLIPKWMQGTEIYNPSKIMRSIQYVWEKNIIRIWKDEVLDYKDNDGEHKIDNEKLLESNSISAKTSNAIAD